MLKEKEPEYQLFCILLTVMAALVKVPVLVMLISRT